MKEVLVSMPYIGAVLSVNHFKIRGRFTRRETKDWMMVLSERIRMQSYKQYKRQKWQTPLEVIVSARFENKRSSPDLHNLAKVILDSVEAATGVNDKEIRYRDGNVIYGKDPELYITVREIGGELARNE